MSWKLILRLAELAISAILATALFLAWRAERADRAKLADELSVAQQSLTQATDRQQSRDSDLLHTLANLAAQKRDIQTPAQILHALPQQIPLPQPLVVTMPPPNPSASSTNQMSYANDPGSVPSKANGTAKPRAPEPQAVIPSADLKPLYDFALDCKACQAKLTAAQSDLADEKTKTATLTKERDEAVRTAKGGSALQRFARAAKWLLIGAAAGTLAARAIK
jgi:type II secretory pathway pseudopilin PulG